MDANNLFIFGPTCFALGIWFFGFACLDNSIIAGGMRYMTLLLATVGLTWMIAFAVLGAVPLLSLLLGIGIPVVIFILGVIVVFLMLRGEI